MRNSLGLFLLLCVSSLLFTGCGKKTPKGILPEDKMEDVLYDFHMAQSFDVPYVANGVDAEQIMQALYKKHHITKAEFDSSMAYYTKDLETLSEMYDRLGERFDDAAANAGIQMARERNNSMGVTGDTIDIWSLRRLYLLTPSKYNHQLTFSIKADTSFYQHDLFRLSFNPHFILSPEGMSTGKAAQNSLAVGLLVQYENDSVSAEIRTIYSTNESSVILRADSTYKIKSVSGFFSLTSKSSTPLIVDGIQLLKFHTSDMPVPAVKNGEAAVPSTKVQLDPDSMPMPMPKRMSPQEIRSSRPVEHKVRIRKR